MVQFRAAQQLGLLERKKRVLLEAARAQERVSGVSVRVHKRRLAPKPPAFNLLQPLVTPPVPVAKAHRGAGTTGLLTPSTGPCKKSQSMDGVCGVSARCALAIGSRHLELSRGSGGAAAQRPERKLRIAFRHVFVHRI